MSMTLEEAIAKCEERIETLTESISTSDLDDTVEKLLARNSAKCADEQRQLAEWLRELQETRKERDYWQEKAHSYEQTIFKLTDAISKQPEIIRCGECVNFVERDFCKVAGHNVHRKSNCMKVFGAERRSDEQPD